MSYAEQNEQFVSSAAAVAMTTTGDKLTFAPAVPVEIVSFGVLVDTTVVDTAGTGFTLACDLRPTANTDTGRTIGGGVLGTGTFTRAQAILLVAGAGTNIARSTPPPNSTGDTARTVQPGQEAVLRLTAAVATTGTARYFIEYRILPRTLLSTEINVTS